MQDHYSKLSEQFRACKSSVADDFGEGCHAASAEPYFYDSAYKPVKRDYALPIDEYGKCVLAREITTDSKTSKCKHKNQPIKWACTSECKIPTDDEVCAINIKQSFDKPIQDVRQVLDVTVIVPISTSQNM